MNTVFKFYIQAWLILSVAAPVALMWFVERWRTKGQEVAPSVARRPSSVVRTALGLILIAAAALGLLLGLMYPAFAIPAKIGDRYTRDAPRGLDGMAYMIRDHSLRGRGWQRAKLPPGLRL